MTTRVRVADAAGQDLHEILSHLAERAGSVVTRRYEKAFETVYFGLVRFPASGAARPALGKNTRVKIVYPYIVVYDHEGEEATILRVLDGRRDIRAGMIRR